MRRGDAGVALFWLVLGAAVCAHALRLGVWDISGPATGFVPLLAGIVLFAGGAGILLAARPWGAPAPPFWPVRAAGLRAMTVLVALAVMAGCVVLVMAIFEVMYRAAPRADIRPLGLPPTPSAPPSAVRRRARPAPARTGATPGSWASPPTM